MRLRSLLFVPGDRPDQMSKACGAGADALILDLEDAVSAAHKARARSEVASFLKAAERRSPVFVRINALSSRLADEDLAATAAAAPDGFVLPKAEGAASILELVRRLEALGASAPPILPIATETPLAMFKLGEYASVPDRLCALTWGAEDLPAAIGASQARLPDGSFTPPYEIARSWSLFAAHAAGVPAIETVYPAFRDLDGLALFAARAARDGFGGMLAIHPAQITAINAAFTPSAEAVARAQRIIAAFAQDPDRGVIDLDGAMLDAPHLKQAHALIARAAAS
ncbi:MAG: CoA ester lyase [Steroidobacteraceae bacterium]|jgi:citrate lyase subunit beta/citryl-CoA lyase